MPRRTTLTLDDDVARKLDEQASKEHRPLRAIVNDALRRGLYGSKRAKAHPALINARPMGVPHGVSFDCIAELLDDVEGPSRR